MINSSKDGNTTTSKPKTKKSTSQNPHHVFPRATMQDRDVAEWFIEHDVPNNICDTLDLGRLKPDNSN